MNIKSLSRLRAIVLSSRAGKAVRRVGKQVARGFSKGARSQADRAVKTGERSLGRHRAALLGEADVLRKQSKASRHMGEVDFRNEVKVPVSDKFGTYDALRHRDKAADILEDRASTLTNRATPIAEKLVKNQRRVKNVSKGAAIGAGAVGAAAIGGHQIVKRVNDPDRKQKRFARKEAKKIFPDLPRKVRNSLADQMRERVKQNHAT